MALSNPRSFFGVHSVAPYDRTTREFKGILKVLGSSSLSLSGELVSLNGGSSKYPFAVEDGLITAELSLVFREYPNFVFELFLGKSPTDNAADAAGDVSTAANASGSSVIDGTTGIATVTATAADEADLKFAKYVIVAASATTVDIFASSDIDFATGTDASYENDALKINAAPITIADSSAVIAVADFGLDITSGSGTVAMTSGDTATFDVRSINTGSTEVTIGGSTDIFPEFGALVLGKKRGDSSMIEFDLFRVKGVGLPIGLTENEFSEAEVTAQAFQDNDRGGVFSMRHIKASV